MKKVTGRILSSVLNIPGKIDIPPSRSTAGYSQDSIEVTKDVDFDRRNT